MRCKICGEEMSVIFDSIILNKYFVKYFQCKKCNFIQTEQPYWLEEAYSHHVTDFDTGLVSRNIYFARLIESLILRNFDQKGKFLDYGGGYGIMVRILRDNGFEFYLEDEFSPNIFATEFNSQQLPKNTYFELISSIEVFEHLTNPLESIEHLLQSTDNLLFSTELFQEKQPDKNWWFFSPQHGQHISFYHYDTLKFISSSINCNLFSNQRNIHILSKRNLPKNILVQRSSKITMMELFKSIFNSIRPQSK